jgi:hypothetical protein
MHEQFLNCKESENYATGTAALYKIALKLRREYCYHRMLIREATNRSYGCGITSGPYGSFYSICSGSLREKFICKSEFGSKFGSKSSAKFSGSTFVTKSFKVVSDSGLSDRD